jgi:hypothetical protein
MGDRRPEALQRKPARLILDSFKGHYVNNVKEDLYRCNNGPAIISQGLTSTYQ